MVLRAALLLGVLSLYFWIRFKSSRTEPNIFVINFKRRAFPSNIFLSVVSPQFLFMNIMLALLMVFVSLGIKHFLKYADFEDSSIGDDDGDDDDDDDDDAAAAAVSSPPECFGTVSVETDIFRIFSSVGLSLVVEKESIILAALQLFKVAIVTD
jgi:hypothetical protein